MRNSKIFWCLLYVGFLNFVSGHNFKVPDPKCNVEDFKCVAEFSRYITTILSKGDQELGIEPIDPMHYALIEESLSDFQYSLSDSDVVGFKDVVLNYLTIVKSTSMHFDFTLPYYEQKGKYKASGKILNAPINGEGTYYFNATNIHLVVDVKKEFYEKDGHTYLKLTNRKAVSDLLGSGYFNLNTEVETKHKEFVKLINENPKGAAQLFQAKVSLVNVDRIFDEYNKILAVIPITDIVVDEVSIK